MQHLSHRLSLILLVMLLVLAPLLRSGKVSLAVLTLELLALALILLWAWRPGHWRALPRAQWGFLLLLLALPVLYLLPLPAVMQAWLPGRDMHLTAAALVNPAHDPAWAPLALVPGETLGGLLELLIPVSVFLVARSLSTRQLQWLMALVLGLAAFQALIGLVQYGAGMQGPAVIATEHANAGNAAGTYTSRNNYAGFLYLALMPCLALYLANIGRNGQRGKSPFRQRLLFWSSLRGHKAFLYGALALLLILGVIFSRSRAGIGLTMLGLLLMMGLLARRIGGSRASVSLLGRILTVAGGVAVAIGLAPVWERFATQDPVSDARFTIFAGTLDAIRESFPLGFGPGAFQESFHPWQYLAYGRLINQAHNSYLEWVYDGGLLALGLIVAGLLLFARGWLRVWSPGEWGDFRYLQVGAGMGLLLMLLHELVDYNLFVPANMAMFALFAAVFFHEYREAPRTRQRSTRRQGEGVAPSPRERGALPVSPGPGTSNPFQD